MIDIHKKTNLSQFEPKRTALCNSFMRHGWKTLGDVIEAIELNGVDDKKRDYPTVAGPVPRNAGAKAHLWLFDVLDSVGYDWKQKINGRNPHWHAPNMHIDILAIANSLKRLGEAYTALPDDLKRLISDAVTK